LFFVCTTLDFAVFDYLDNSQSFFLNVKEMKRAFVRSRCRSTTCLLVAFLVRHKKTSFPLFTSRRLNGETILVQNIKGKMETLNLVTLDQENWDFENQMV